MTEAHLEYLKQFLPKYLSPEQQESLFKSIKEDFPHSKDPYKIYRELEDKAIFYQGDGIIDIPFSSLNIENGEFALETYPGAILSNTCDIALENTRDYSPNVLIAAIYSLEEFVSFLKESNVSAEKIKSFVSNLRENIISSLFYLPEIKAESNIILPESFVRFDHTTSIPIDFLNSKKYNKEYITQDGDRLFTFSNYGFYLFICKLSVHFCRFREGVFRN